VKRRARPRDAGVPEELCRFAPSEWPDAGCGHEALRAWQAAALAWLDGDERRALPFGEFGDVVDVLRESGRIGRQLQPCPHEYRPAQYRD
jgi:hypothetical protein